MRRTQLLLLVLFCAACACAGCQTALHGPASQGGTQAEAAPDAASEESSTGPEAEARENRHLTLAAIYLDKGEEEKACLQLRFFLEQKPRHVARVYRAELLRKLGRPAEAKEEFQTAIGFLQDERLPDPGKLIQCHSRLGEIAEEEEDELGRMLHRGIALYWLAQAPAGSAEEEEMLPAEGLLCKAAASLRVAHDLDPHNARAAWYLHQVWRKLGQDQPACRFLALARHNARDNALGSPLTAAEERGLSLAEKTQSPLRIVTGRSRPSRRLSAR
jgi:tetratricopeptide (TPR) repeat protein